MREPREWNREWVVLCLCVLMSCASGARADFTFGEPVNLGAPINTSLDESFAMTSSDGLSLYYGSGDASSTDIWVAKRRSTKDAWGPGASLGPIVNSSNLDMWPFVSADGLTLYFSRIKPDWSSVAIWQTTRPTIDDDWTSPVKLGAPINISGTWCPCISANGLEFYFASDRHEHFGSENDDLYVCKRASIQDAWSEPVALSVLNSSAADYGPCLSADGLVMFFNSWRAGGYGICDIYMATRPTLDADWSSPANVGPPVSSSYLEMSPHLSSDGRTLYFCGNPFFDPRPGGMGGVDIWTASIDPIVDFNGDGLVDLADIDIMIDCWGSDDSLCDIGPMPWGDGIVDVEDLVVLVECIIEVRTDADSVANGE